MYFLISFIGLFSFRLIYGYLTVPESRVGISSNSNNYNQIAHNVSFELGRKNYATDKVKTSDVRIQTPGFTQILNQQKYEKIGTLSSRTSEFEEEEKKIRNIITLEKAIIQFEENHGLPGHRTLHLGIGVNPERFDEMILELKKIGRITAIQINKTDKTNEFRELNAEREALAKTISALRSLKGKGGKIEEFIQLENKILETEQLIQSKGVKLGDFDSENEFCTVKFSLVEDKNELKKSFLSNLFHRIKSALEWTIKYYFYFSLICFFGAFGIYTGLLILDKIKSILNFPNLDKSNKDKT
ncbi:MAG: DUF4349 domain-containing protein [Leptospiraceae bacterium]|nr:DUF4349 domain-containing protein [Leptospiraceae bacterium]